MESNFDYYFYIHNSTMAKIPAQQYTKLIISDSGRTYQQKFKKNAGTTVLQRFKNWIHKLITNFPVHCWQLSCIQHIKNTRRVWRSGPRHGLDSAVKTQGPHEPILFMPLCQHTQASLSKPCFKNWLQKLYIMNFPAHCSVDISNAQKLAE